MSLFQEWIDHVAHWLPTQGPIKEFIHHNTLHALQGRPFFEAVRVASRLNGARAWFPLSHYRRLHEEGRIHAGAVDAFSPAEQELMWDRSLPDEELHAPLASQGIRSRWRTRHGVDLDARIHPTLFRLAGNFFDQGIAVWQIPHAEEGLFRAVARIVEGSFLPLPPFNGKLSRELLRLDPEAAAMRALGLLVGDLAHAERYILELVLSNPGWAGMIRRIEIEPTQLVLERKASLGDWVALHLVAEASFLSRNLGKGFAPITERGEALAPLPFDVLPKPSRTEEAQMLWHRAYEETYRRELLGSIQARRDSGGEASSGAKVFFCIDDRECSLRRYLEDVDPSIETYGTAGFFGIDCVFQGVDDAFPLKSCPVPVRPRHLIREVRTERRLAKGNRGFLQRLLHLEPGSNTLLRGWLISQTIGFAAAFRLAWSIFKPGMSPATATSFDRVRAEAEFQVRREGQDDSVAGYALGYTTVEMADRVASLLRSTGALRRPIDGLFVFVGHGASSANNPYYAAYDCGACSGKAGAPNARAIAAMANLPEVRVELAARGIAPGDGCWFVGAVHDTTRDEIAYYDLEKIPSSLRTNFERYRHSMEEALEKNALERIRRFELVDSGLSGPEARDEVRKRSTAIFEPRPEYNHATNAACVVGRRALTRGLFLDRRVFLNSYDPALDPDGVILSGILGAVVPVCGGINLEYYFSRLDPGVYGAGSKLPHNVCGLIGVMNGTEGDLLTGLPTQMTEVHDPVRLMILVEQEPEVALRAACRDPGVFEWVENGWVEYYCLSDDRSVFRFVSGRMVEVDLKGFTPKRAPNRWEDLIRESTENLPVLEVGG